MHNLHHSEYLEEIISFAQNFDGRDNAPLTAERFLIAVIDYIIVEVIRKDDCESDELKESYNILTKQFNSDIRKIEEFKKELVEYIENRDEDDDDYLTRLYMQECLYDARVKAFEDGYNEITTDLVVDRIFERPDDYISVTLARMNDFAGADKSEFDKIIENLNEKSLDDWFTDDWNPHKNNKDDEEDDDESETSQIDPKIFLSDLIGKIKDLQEDLLGSIYGQDNAISVFTSGYFQAEILSFTDKKRKRPRAIYLFAGPPGVGKTYLAEKSAELLNLPFMRFDMSEYSDKEANLEFCGSDKVYKDGKEGNVTSFVSENPRSILLFDEIEKAHINVIHLFLQMLDAGRLRDNFTDKEVSFTDTIIIFTTNAGKQLYDDPEITDLSNVSRKVILKALQNDVNSETGEPYFPSAICSRFATGNVVMFNHVTANNLVTIAKREIKRNIESYSEKIGINITVDENVYTSLLFAEGGGADARIIKSRAESFLNEEIFELLRLMTSYENNYEISNLKSIDIGVVLPDDDDILKLFMDSLDNDVLVFSSDKIFNDCKKNRKVNLINCQSIESFNGIIKETDINFILIDYNFGRKKKKKYINIEDAESDARDFFSFVRTNYPEIPVCFIQTEEYEISDEERASFRKKGVQNFFRLDDGCGEFPIRLEDFCRSIHQQNSMIELAKANKIVSFETAQIIKNRGEIAEIKLFDFKLETAVDAEDTKNLVSTVSKPDVHFDQVIGAEDAKKELQFFVDYLKDPKKYLVTGVGAPKGVILYGPPGTGKTMLAKAMACEADVSFISTEGNAFLKKYVGEGSEKIHELFRIARKYAPSILFIDEIDAIAKERDGSFNSGSSEATLTALLTEMDGFKRDNSKPVFVLAATNFNVEPGHDKSLDPALIRRFDRKIYIDLPNRDERIAYIKLRLREKSIFKVSDDKISNIAVRSTGMSLSSIDSVIDLSMRSAIRRGLKVVNDEIFDEAFETFNGGETRKYDESQLKRIAIHEAGHALVCFLSGEKPSYVTIVARGDHGGYMQHDDNENKAIYTKAELLSKIRTALAGRAAEIVYYGEIDGLSTGASGDLETATNIATRIVCNYGMCENTGLAYVGKDLLNNGSISSDVKKSVNEILSLEMNKAIETIKNNKISIDTLVNKLLDKNHLTGDEIANLLTSSIF